MSKEGPVLADYYADPPGGYKWGTLISKIRDQETGRWKAYEVRLDQIERARISVCNAAKRGRLDCEVCTRTDKKAKAEQGIGILYVLAKRVFG